RRPAARPRSWRAPRRRGASFRRRGAAARPAGRGPPARAAGATTAARAGSAWRTRSWNVGSGESRRNTLIRIGKAEFREHLALAALHAARIAFPLVAVALQVEQAVHQEVRVMGLDALALLARLARHHRRADHDVARDLAARRMVVGKAQDVGRVILAAELAVEAPRLGARDVAHGHVAVSRKRGARPGAQAPVGRNVGGARGALDGEHGFPPPRE